LISLADRLLMHCHEIASLMLMDGASPYEIDEAMKSFDFTMGIYEAEDLVGLDASYELRKAHKSNRDPARRYIPIADRMAEEGRLGKKINVGWYRYPGGNGKVEDPIVDDLVIEESWFAKVERRDFSENEILERVLVGLINEICLILETGEYSIADVDAVMATHFNYPKDRASILAYADDLGAEIILKLINNFAQDDAAFWQPAQSLMNAVKSGKTLQEYFDR